MTMRPSYLAAVAVAALLASCASTRPDADVTRFHLGQPIARSTVFLTPTNSADANSLEFRTYAQGVGEQLRALGFTPVPTLNQAEIVGTLNFGQTTRESLSRGSGLSVGIGGGTFGRNVGIGGSVNIPVGKSRPNQIAVNMLELQLKRRSDNSVIWEGRAVSEARSGTEAAAPGIVVPRLAGALLQGFPGQSGQTVRVALK